MLDNFFCLMLLYMMHNPKSMNWTDNLQIVHMTL